MGFKPIEKIDPAHLLPPWYFLESQGLEGLGVSARLPCGRGKTGKERDCGAFLPAVKTFFSLKL